MYIRQYRKELNMEPVVSLFVAVAMVALHFGMAQINIWTNGRFLAQTSNPVVFQIAPLVVAFVLVLSTVVSSYMA